MTLNVNDIDSAARLISEYVEITEWIKAIKELRGVPGIELTLKDAKDVVDSRRPFTDYYENVRFFVDYITKRLDSLKPKYVTLVTTVTHVTVTLPCTMPYSLTVEQARTLRDQLNALGL